MFWGSSAESGSEVFEVSTLSRHPGAQHTSQSPEAQLQLQVFQQDIDTKLMDKGVQYWLIRILWDTFEYSSITPGLSPIEHS